MDMQPILDQWLAEYNKLEELHDKKWDRLNKYEANGDTKKAQATSRKMDEILAKMEGMRIALDILGYTVIYQDHKNIVVVK